MTASLPDLHLEISTKCALACPACPRTFAKGEYAVTDLPLESIKSIVDEGGQYKMVSLCGGHGDPIYHTRFHEVIRELQRLPGEPFIRIATNGSYRSKLWWTRTAQILRPQDEVIFGIDGLSDTAKIHRAGSDWESAWEGIRTLKAEGQARVAWQWILFNFNQHQLPEAARLARREKIDRFLLIGSSRHELTDRWQPTLSMEEARAEFGRHYSEELHADLSPL